MKILKLILLAVFVVQWKTYTAELHTPTYSVWGGDTNSWCAVEEKREEKRFTLDDPEAVGAYIVGERPVAKEKPKKRAKRFMKELKKNGRKNWDIKLFELKAVK